jgi:hypothetical protein
VDEAKIKEIEEKLADLKGLWPKHTVRPNMWQELEDLEAQLEAARAKRADPGTDSQQRNVADPGTGPQE